MKRLSLLLIANIFALLAISQDTIYLDSTRLVSRVLVQDMTIPWDLNFGPDGWLWFNERNGNIYRLNPETTELQHLYKITDVYESYDNSGAHALALHPNFPVTPYIYAHYTNDLYNSTLVRLTYSINLNTIINTKVLIPQISGNITHNGSRIVFDSLGYMYLSMGDGFENFTSQDVDDTNGKILRLNDDGSIPDDNPFPNSYTYSYGHRNPQGLVFGPTGILYSSEHGEANDDEVNIILKSKNYGWPLVEGYCDESSEQAICDSLDIEEPIFTWSPTYAPGGLEYYNHPSIPEWKNCLLQTFLKEKRLTVLPLSEDGLSVLNGEQFHYYIQKYGRLRDVLAAPNGKLYIVTSNQEPNGAWVTPDNYDKVIEIYNPDYEYEDFSSDLEIGSSTLFPVPAEDYLYIQEETDQKTIECELFNTSGELVHAEKLTSVFEGLWQLNLPTSLKGVHILHYTIDGTARTERIVIL